jgi:erythromycin esterase
MKLTLLFLFVFTLSVAFAQETNGGKKLTYTQRKNIAAEKDFVRWAKKNAAPFSITDGGKDKLFSAIDKAVGDAKIVAVSEGAHNVKEFIKTNAAIVEYLIKNKGFTTVVCESGLPESRITHDYILGKQVEKKEWIGGLNKMYGWWTEYTDMIEWMRTYSQNVSNDKKIKFYGIDITGSYTDLRPTFKQISDCLEKVDPVYTHKIQSELNPVLEIVYSKEFRKAPRHYHDSLTLEQKYLLEQKTVELINYISNNKGKILKQYSNEDYEWLRQNSISLFQAVSYYKNSTNAKNTDYNEFVGLNGRELAMAQNFQWVYKSDTTAKILIICHNVHTKTNMSYLDTTFQYFTPFGAFVRHAFGNRYYCIGCAYDNGVYWDNWKKNEPRVIKNTPPAKKGEIDYTLKAVGKPYFFVDFKKINPKRPAFSWLRTKIMIREHDEESQITPDEFDGYLFYDTISIPTENK